MARALHKHIMRERERKRQGEVWNFCVNCEDWFDIFNIQFGFFPEEEEVDKMMEQKLKEEEERKRKKEMEERMSLEETKEQVCYYDLL